MIPLACGGRDAYLTPMNTTETPLFKLRTEYVPTGDQPAAIEQLASNIEAGVRDQVLLGVTGSGKTFTVANVIAQVNRPALVLAPNKTLAAQLYNEFRALFPENAVEYFVSYYDYYQPEAYVPASDTYIEKDSAINDDIDKLRHAATHALLTRRDVIIVASVSCIYGLGSPEYYARLIIPVEVGQRVSMDAIITKLVDVQYQRNDMDFHRGTFRVRGDVLEVIPAYEHERALRLEFFGDEIEAVREIDPLTGEILGNIGKTVIYPASHYVSDRDNLERAMSDVRDELGERLRLFQSQNKLVEAQRLEQRTQLDLEMMQELGYCTGIENYSRHLDGPQEEIPATLLDYFPDDFVLFADESHISIPQVGGMFKGDRSRKTTLVDFGFRLPSALDNRPLEFHEILERLNQVVYVSATPGKWELERSQGIVAEQIIRPTGLLDPEVEVRPVKGQIDDLLGEYRARVEKHERVLVTTLTKRMAEDLTEYLNSMGVAARYLHSDIDGTMERMAIIKALRAGEFDVLVGINLLREGLDIPEVSLVTILDADKEGFLRSTGSLIQTFGRAARNAGGKVLLYADTVTASMSAAMGETARRRAKQQDWNETHGITPTTINKPLATPFDSLYTSSSEGKGKRGRGKQAKQPAEASASADITAQNVARYLKQFEREMRDAARDLEFEKAAALRDRIKQLREQFLIA